MTFRSGLGTTEMGEIITDDGVLIEQVSGLPDLMQNQSTATAIIKAELDTQIMTARQYPRSIKLAMSNILSLATLDEETATECIYALKRSGKPVRGPSIRLAEIMAGQWGNCRDMAQVVHIDRVNKVIVAEGAFHDLETNRGTRTQVQRRISTKDGHLFSDDMIVVTGNAACAIARRNAILAGIPKGIWRKAFDACEQIIRGQATTLVESRNKALTSLAHFNLSPEQVCRIMAVGGTDDLTLDDLATLRVICASLKNGEQSVDELLRGIEPDKRERVTAATAKHEAPAVFNDAGLPSVDAAPVAAVPAQPEPAAKKPGKAQEKPTAASALVSRLRVRGR